MVSGAVNMRAWKMKRDAFADSVKAYNMSTTISIDEIATGAITHTLTHSHNATNTHITDKQEEQPAAKRGAPCLGDVNEGSMETQKLIRASKRANVIERAGTRDRLMSEAAQVARRLLSTLEGFHATCNQEHTARDHRFENYDFVFSVGVRRYVARCRENGEPVQISTIHDICISSNAFVKQAVREAQQRERAIKVKEIATDGCTIDLCASLIVSIWSAVCITSYFMKHQSGDAFKPFASGIMYALKRGLWLPNGVMIIPQLDDLSAQLPVLRSLVASSTAKQLQAASHKGLCAIHKAISSIDTMDLDSRQTVQQRLSVSASIARDLQSHADLRRRAAV
jgi:hypothetical protein